MPDSDAKADAGHTSSGPPKGISKGTPTKQVNREVAYAARASPAPSHASESVESQVGDAASIGDPQDKRESGGAEAAGADDSGALAPENGPKRNSTAAKALAAAAAALAQLNAMENTDTTKADAKVEPAAAEEAPAAEKSVPALGRPRLTLLTVQMVAATLLRLLVLISLRSFPLRACAAVLVAYTTYVVCWVLFERVSSKRVSYADAAKHYVSPFTAVLYGVSTHSWRLNVAQLGFHTLIALLFLDFYYAPHVFPSYYEYNLRFARIGALSPTTASLHVRYPHPLPPLDGLWESDNESGVLHDAALYAETPVRVVWRRVDERNARIPAGAAVRDSRRWERGPLLRLAEDTDWTATALLENLWPATQYEWRLAFVHNNTFAPLPERPVPFVTWPDPKLSAYLKTRRSLHTSERNALDDPNHFTFAATSCIKPNFPYHPAQFWLWNWLLRAVGIGRGPGGVAQRNRIRGFDLMAERLVGKMRGAPGIRFLLELGDVIYADVPHYEGAFVSSYRKLYRNLFASNSFRRIYTHIPVLGIFDDHEVINNWSGAGDSGKSLPDSPPPAFSPAMKVWSEYIGDANPPGDKGDYHFSFQYGDSAFFVVDARTHRTHPNLYGPERTMLGEKQRNDLFAWLAKVNQTTTFKFIVTPVPFTSVWGGPLDLDGHLDGWPAYADDRKAVLDVLQYVPNVIIISGDRHEFAAVSMRDSVLEFSTSPLSMFYVPIRTASQQHVVEEGSEVFLKYLPDGHHKWTEFEVDTRDPHDPIMRVTVLINGKEAWNVAVHGHPVRRAQGALGSLAQSLFELLGFKPRAWFD